MEYSKARENDKVTKKQHRETAVALYNTMSSRLLRKVTTSNVNHHKYP